MPRIIAGKARGINLVTPAGDKTRPTSDKAKEALFSILMPYITNSSFLDLFAGSGQIGLEAVSRGAAEAVIVEQSPKAIRCIQQNIEKTGMSEQVRLLRGPALKMLKMMKEDNKIFDLIYLDPPWQQALSEFKALAPLLTEIISNDGFIIIEHESRNRPEEYVTKLKCLRHCQYGSAMLSFYQLNI